MDGTPSAVGAIRGRLSELIQPIAALGKGGVAVMTDLAFPPVCRLCDQPVTDRADDFCTGCEQALSILHLPMRSACVRCGFPRLPHPSANSVSSEETHSHAESAGESPDDGAKVLCGQCQRLDFEFSSVTALWLYRGRAREAVIASKYSHHAALGEALGRRLGAWVAQRLACSMPDVITFIPSHLTRQLSRGGNGCQVIAEAVGRFLKRPCRQLVGLRRRIAKQAWLDDEARATNVQGAFRLPNRLIRKRNSAIQGRRVLLVDDVLTTGATANEATRVLLAGGAEEVALAVVARAVRSV